MRFDALEFQYHINQSCFVSSFFKTPGGEAFVTTALCPLNHPSTSCCLPRRAAAPPSLDNFSTSTQGSSTYSNLSITSSRPLQTPAAGYVAPWTAGHYWEHTGTSSSTCTPATSTSWRITSDQSPKTTSQAPSFVGAPAMPSVLLRCARKEGTRLDLRHLMKPGAPRSVGPSTSP